MTIYEILAIVSPVLTIVMGGLLGALFKSVTSNFDRRITNLESDIKDVRKDITDFKSDVNSRLGKIEGLLEGYFANAKPK